MWTRNRERHSRPYMDLPLFQQALPRFAMAFQPIVNVISGEVFAYEALVRSPKGESANTVLAKVARKHYNMFDMACRTCALQSSIREGVLHKNVALSVNINPNAGSAEKTSLKRTCEEAESLGLPLNRLIFEFIENEEISSFTGLQALMDEYRSRGVRIAIDDFGAGYSGLKLLSKLQPDIIKIDLELVGKVDVNRTTEIIIKAIVQACFELNIQIVAEGVERYETAMRLRDMGIALQQGTTLLIPS